MGGQEARTDGVHNAFDSLDDVVKRARSHDVLDDHERELVVLENVLLEPVAL